MRQLGELKKNSDKFAAAEAEVIVVFREEQKGVEGLQIIKKKTGVDFTLALDLGKKQTGQYSPAKMEFTNYVIDKSGVVTEIVVGDLRNRAKSQQLLDALAAIKKAEETDSDKKKRTVDSDRKEKDK